MHNKQTAIALTLIALVATGCHKDPYNLKPTWKVATTNFSVLIPTEWDAHGITDSGQYFTVDFRSPQPISGMLNVNNRRWADRQGLNHGSSDYTFRDLGPGPFPESLKKYYGKTASTADFKEALLPSGAKIHYHNHGSFGHVLGPFRDYALTAKNGHNILVLGILDEEKARHQAELILSTLE
jgi:hypothetical protein